MSLEMIFLILIVILIIGWAFSPRYATAISVPSGAIRTVLIIMIVIIIIAWLFHGHVIRL